MVTCKPLPQYDESNSQRQTSPIAFAPPATSPLVPSKSPPQNSSSSYNDSGGLALLKYPSPRQPQNDQRHPAVRQEKKLPDIPKMEDKILPMHSRRRSDVNCGEENPGLVTPKSSWESLLGEKPALPSSGEPRAKSISPSAQPSNPFRRRTSQGQEVAVGSTDDHEVKTRFPSFTPQVISSPGIDDTDPINIKTAQNYVSKQTGHSGRVLSQNSSASYSNGLEELASKLPPTGSVGSPNRAFPDHEDGPRNQLPALEENGIAPKGALYGRVAEDTGTLLPSSPKPDPPPNKIDRVLDSSAPNHSPPPKQVSPDVELNPPPAQLLDLTKSKRQTETYQIRLINWYDASSQVNPRRSPVMVQNANGPCPLLALVNALVLSTPATAVTALVETLRVREQISLGLLLDAVFDELISGRRGDAAQNLPDVSDLYAFLVNLHSGMNVNPCFVSSGELMNLMDAPIDIPSSSHDFRKPGGFEGTREMRLYSTFAIPLIHGWIPPRTHPGFAALKRRAINYEDAQNLLFREEDLEEKLKDRGLDPEEQLVLEDIASVKYFLSSTATQLTGYGLDTITETLIPGSLAILFRNDHFSTLYRHPRSGQLLTLVTDMGYAGHDEVVWESLVDVSGEGSEFFSGDFRPVGSISNEARLPNRPLDDGSDWTTVTRGSRKTPQAKDSSTPQLGESPPIENLNISNSNIASTANHEQEDHDLALAMQLQEEEEERERQEAAARRREDELSQAYVNNSDAQGRRTFPGLARGARSAPTVPPRGGSNTQQGPSIRQGVRRESSSDDAPPPSYEQAAKGPAYHPSTGHPFHAQSPLGRGNSTARSPPQQSRRPRGSSAYSEHASAFGGSPSVHSTPRTNTLPRGRGPGVEGTSSNLRKRNGPSLSASAEEDRKEDKCTIM